MAKTPRRTGLLHVIGKPANFVSEINDTPVPRLINLLHQQHFPYEKAALIVRFAIDRLLIVCRVRICINSFTHFAPPDLIILVRLFTNLP
jgi:hypothetical protein